MSYYTQLLRQRVRQALASLLERTERARDLATVLREVATEIRLSLELRAEAAKEDVGVLRQRVDQALTSLLAVERDHWAAELAVILYELADELDPPPPCRDA